MPDRAESSRDDLQESPPGPGELLAGIERGDRESLRLFFEAWFDRLFALARAATRRDESFCLDVVQEVMLRIVRRPPFANERRALEVWLSRAVYSTAIDLLRKEKRRSRHEREAAVRRSGETRCDFTAEAEREDRLRWLGTELARLEDLEKKLLHRRFGLGETLEQVGRALGLAGNAAHGRIQRIIARLRNAAKNRFGYGF